MNRACHLSLCVMVVLAISSTVFAADLKFSRHYSSNMVLQRDKKVTIRGLANKGANVTVSFAGQTKKAKADENGEWVVELDPLKANSTGQKLECRVASGKGRVALDNVVVGDVFLFARQTTIDISLGRDEAGKKAAAEVKSVRVIMIKTVPAYDPQRDLAKEATSGWTKLTKDAALKMDAAAFYMAKDLAAKTDVPIGIINVNMGRHFPIGWMSKEALLQTKAVFGEKAGQVDSMIKGMESLVNPSAHKKRNDEKRGYPRPPAREDALYPAAGYNAVLHPMRGLTLKGLLLQLGNDYPYYPYAKIERDGKGTTRGYLGQAYQDSYLIRKNGIYLAPITTPRLPVEFRKVFADNALPVGLITPPGSDLVTLGRFHYEVRELQRRASKKLDGVDLIQPSSKSIPFSAQPADEAFLGARCATWLQGAVYKRKGVAPTGPVFDRVETNGSTAQIFFKPGTAVGLKAAKGALSYFEIAAANITEDPLTINENLKYSPAKATIDGETIRLTSDSVQKIAYVRYNWKEKPDQGLTGAGGLPAVPFNTDGHKFPRRIFMLGEEPLPARFSKSITEWDTDGPVVYNGKLDTSLKNGKDLGPTGLRVSTFGPNLYVNNTYSGSPADGKILPGDYLYKVNGKPFGEDIFSQIAEAITLAETEEAKGLMSFELLRKGKKMRVEITLEVLGTYSDTAPYNCPKTDKIVANAEAYLGQCGGIPPKNGRMSGTAVHLNAEAMFLLAAGTPKHQGLVRRQVYERLLPLDISQGARSVPLTHAEKKELKKLGKDAPENPGGAWGLSADILFLSEYYLTTGDRNVLPYLKYKCDGLTSIQIRSPEEIGPWPEVQVGQTGGWRHNFYGGSHYGTMQAIAAPAALGYQLTKEAGVQYKFLGLERVEQWFLHNGARVGHTLYGYLKEPYVKRERPLDPDKIAAGKLNPGNGAVAAAAIFFKFRGDKAVSDTCAYVATHSWNNTAYAHGGHFWANFYTPLGAKLHGKESLQFFMKGNRNYQELQRMHDHSRQLGKAVGVSQYIAYVAPRERLRILGAPESVFAPNPPKALDLALAAYFKRDYAASEKAAQAVINRGGLTGLDLQKAEQLRNQAALIQKSIASDLAKVKKLLAEKKPYEASLDLAQLKAVMPEGNTELANIEAALNSEEMKSGLPADTKRYEAVRESLRLVLPTELPVDEGQWRDLTSQHDGRGVKNVYLRRFAFKSGKPLPEPTTWRIKTLETIDLAPKGWMNQDFDDSSWGKATLPISWRENHTALLRAPFDVADPSTIKALRLKQYAKRLDGIHIYINGIFVARISGAEGGGNIIVPLNDLALKALKKGKNTLALTYKNNWRWGTYFKGAGSVTYSGLNLSLQMQSK